MSVRERAAHVRWAFADAVQGTEAARAGLQAKFEREADPDGTLSPREKAVRAGHLRKAHMLKMSNRISQGTEEVRSDQISAAPSTYQKSLPGESLAWVRLARASAFVLP